MANKLRAMTRTRLQWMRVAAVLYNEGGHLRKIASLIDVQCKGKLQQEIVPIYLTAIDYILVDEFIKRKEWGIEQLVAN